IARGRAPYYLLSERDRFGKSAEPAERPGQPRSGGLIEKRGRVTTIVEVTLQEFHCLPKVASVGVDLAQPVPGLHLKADNPESGCDRQRPMADFDRGVEFSIESKLGAYPGQDPGETRLITQCFSRCLGLAQDGKGPPVLSNQVECAAQIQP